MNLDNRMKDYEKAYNIVLPKRLPILIRLDGKAFHSLLKGANKPFDDYVMSAMDFTAKSLINEVTGAVLAYIQSDEISILICNYSSVDFMPYFANELQKVVSVSASIATSSFNNKYKKGIGNFDSRAFILPREEVCNYFIWRQEDFTRNSVQMLARSLYTHAECVNKKNPELQDMIIAKGQNWNDLATKYKRGRCVYRKQIVKGDIMRNKIIVDNEIPIFTQDRGFVSRFVNIEGQHGK